MPVDVEVMTKGGEKIPELEVVRGSTRNISSGGLFLETPVFGGDLLNGLLFKEKLLKLIIHLPDPALVNVMGRAIWAEGLEDKQKREHGLGIEFIWITKNQREQITSYISKTKGLK